MEAIFQYSGNLYNKGDDLNKILTLEALHLGAVTTHIHTTYNKAECVVTTTVVLSYDESIAKKLQEFLHTKQKENVC